ncbi:T9SS type A sorting domain-containing protein [Mangrovibacterium diazotrophicum]|nr:T9SS type A sorting domain-containing protein [Mangrovibacterium diazotrophicum]
MKFIFTAISLILLFSPAKGQLKTMGKAHVHAPVCYASDEVHRVYVEPPTRIRLKSAQTTAATINVTYIGFSDEAKTAFAYAVDIWEGLINSPVTINILARWTPLESGVLGSCAPTDYLENFDGAPLKNYYYPIALAEKLAGKELNNSYEYEISAQFNSSNESWYFGTDGNTPSTKYDFVSVVLHEIAHGLGFTGLCYESTSGNQTVGGYGWIEDHPGIFDDYMINFDGDKLVDQTKFPNFSTTLFDEFESGYLIFKNDETKSQTNNSYPRLYAPLTYDEGSSLYHLNESTYFPGNPSSLMTPSIGRGEAIHNPGPVTLAIFDEMGWVYTTIIHDELPDTEDTTTPLTVEAQVISDNGLDSTSVKVVYTYSDFTTPDTLQLNYQASTSLFTNQIPINGASEIRYYLIANDVDGNLFALPTQAPDTYFNVLIGVDQTPPTLTHEPVVLQMESDQTLTITAQAEDNIGVANVKMEYAINDQDFQTVTLDEADDAYQKTITLPTITDGDSIRYRLIATDTSSQALTTILPSNGYFVVTIEGFYDAVTNYSNNFDTPDRDFISTSFYTATEEGFDNASLNSPHPYLAPEKSDQNFEYTSILKHPIILQENGEMSFNEVVLVEPGATGTSYSDDDFWDYVIVEGSLDGSTNWLPIIDGYDSRANSSWLTTYNSSTDGDNSTATGTKDLYVARTISLTGNGNFSAGQTVYLRFRLFSDPFAYGWGWSIDDLVIQDPGTAVATIEISPGEVIFFPNPAKDQLNIQGSLKEAPGDILLSIYNNTGQKLLQRKIEGSTANFNAELDISNWQSGIYLVNLQFENGQLISRKIVRE